MKVVFGILFLYFAEAKKNKSNKMEASDIVMSRSKLQPKKNKFPTVDYGDKLMQSMQESLSMNTETKETVINMLDETCIKKKSKSK